MKARFLITITFLSLTILGSSQVNHLSVTRSATAENDAAIQGSALNDALTRTVGVHGFSDALDGQGVWGQARTGVFAQGGDFGIFATGTFRAGLFSGDLEYTGTLIGPVSDIRLKNLLIPTSSYLDLVDKINIIKFNYKHEEFPELNLSKGVQYGVAAQELNKIFPELVHESKSGISERPDQLNYNNKENYKTVNYAGLIPITIAGVQELHIIVRKQEIQIGELLKKVEDLTNALNTLSNN